MADIGCGDGIIDLGVAQSLRPASLLGFDLNLTDTRLLLEEARREGVCSELPSCLEFRQAGEGSLPADDASFDVVLIWSAFEHISDPDAALAEVRRVIRPYGILMLQWSFYHSQHGAHLEEWFAEGWVQITRDHDEVATEVLARGGADLRWARCKVDEFRALNRFTLDTLQSALLAQGFRMAKLELISHAAVHIPAQLASVSCRSWASPVSSCSPPRSSR